MKLSLMKTSAALCDFYLRGSPRLNLLPHGFFNSRGTQRKEDAENRKEKEEITLKNISAALCIYSSFAALCV